MAAHPSRIAIAAISLGIALPLGGCSQLKDYLGDGVIRKVVLLNPLTHLATFGRNAILGGPALWGELAISALLTLLLLFVSFRIFKRFEPALAERV